MQRSEQNKLCFELQNWKHDYSVEIANIVLRIITRYRDIGDMEKIAYGAKNKQIEDLFAKIVDPKFVLDRFKVDVERNKPSRASVHTTVISVEIQAINRDDDDQGVLERSVQHNPKP